MSLQVFLQAQISGAEAFLASQAPETENSTFDFLGRAAWLTLLGEVIPRALLAELKLSRMLLGSSSAEQFFLVLTEADLPHANRFLQTAAEAIARLTHGAVSLNWVSTENLGSWQIVRKRLDDALLSRASAPLAQTEDIPACFAPFSPQSEAGSSTDYFANFGLGAVSAQRVGWSTHHPAQLEWNGGDFSWPLVEQAEGVEDDILFPRRFATDEDTSTLTTLDELAAKSEGVCRWGILRADVDQFESRLRAVNSVEDHIHLSVLLKRFIAGEMAFLCTLPEFWRRVTLLYRGGDDFAVVGAWDALISFAREVQRVYDSFVASNFKDSAGLEGKSMTLALAIAPDADSSLAAVFEQAGLALRLAKTAEPGTFSLFGRNLDAKRLADAEELKTALTRIVRDHRYPPDFIQNLASVYREAGPTSTLRRLKTVRPEKPWRTYMQVSRVLPAGRGKDFSNLRNTVTTHLLGRKAAGVKLRPSSRVGLEWARLATAN